jgi:ATP:ADP antiporter, AAA family
MDWVIYAFNVWVSLFSIMLVSQGWLVAANVFTSREAKRLYGILGVGSVIGAAFGGQFTAIMVYYIGTTNLVLASAVMVGFRMSPIARPWRRRGRISVRQRSGRRGVLLVLARSSAT